MKLKFTLVFLAFLLMKSSSAQDDACKIVGELALPIIETSGLTACMVSVNPLVCEVSIAVHACSQDPACNGVVATIIENGCVFIVEKTDDAIKVIGTSAKDNASQMRQVYESLNTIEGMRWLMQRLSQ